MPIDEDLKKFADGRKYDYEILKSLSLYSEGGRIIIPYSKEYSISRAIMKGDEPKSIKPKGKQSQPWFIPGSNDKCILVEGETSAIAVKHFLDWDFNVFAIGGVNNFYLIEDIKDYFKGRKIILCFDKDEAGHKCTDATIELLKKKKFEGFDIRIMRLPTIPGIKDIDDFYFNYGANEALLRLDILSRPGEKVKIDGEFIPELQKLTKEEVRIGKKIKCINPEHQDSNPSMHIYEDHAYCFACGYTYYVNKKVEETFTLPIDSYYENAKAFYARKQYFYDKSGMFWMWDKEQSRYEPCDDVDIMRMFDRVLGFKGQCVNGGIKAQTLEAMKWYGRERYPEAAKTKWIQFKNKAYSIFSGKVHEVTKEYFFTNPIPWEVGETQETPILDKLFTEWVGEKNKDMLYEMIAYCCYRDYPIQTLFCLYGHGRNGKSCFQRVLTKFIGKENICSTDLDLLVGMNKNRFETAKLYKKLVCQMGETNFGVLTSSSLIKKLTGGDMIGFERKGKDPFDDYSYAKLIIASNSLPSSDDTSDGFYRRWIIIDFPNEFPEGNDIISTIPDREYENLARKVINILPTILHNGKFTCQGSIEDRKKKYIQVSNPLPVFLSEACETDPDSFISYGDLYTEYVHYLASKKQRKVTMREFNSSLENEGFFPERTTKTIRTQNGEKEYKTGKWVDGLRFYASYASYRRNPTQLHTRIEATRKTTITDISCINSVKEEMVGDSCYVSDEEKLLSYLDSQPEPVELGLAGSKVKDIDSLVPKMKSSGLVYEPRPGFIARLR